MYLRPRYQEPTQNFRVFVETLACPEFSGFFGCPQLPTMALLHHFWNPKLNCHFLGRNKAGLQPKSPCFYAFLQWCIRKKQTPCFFWVPFSSFFVQPAIWNRCPKKTGPTVSFYPRNWKCMGSVLSSGPRDRVLVGFQLGIWKISPQLLHTTCKQLHMCILKTYTVNFLPQKKNVIYLHIGRYMVFHAQWLSSPYHPLPFKLRACRALWTTCMACPSRHDRNFRPVGSG